MRRGCIHFQFTASPRETSPSKTIDLADLPTDMFPRCAYCFCCSLALRCGRTRTDGIGFRRRSLVSISVHFSPFGLCRRLSLYRGGEEQAANTAISHVKIPLLFLPFLVFPGLIFAPPPRVEVCTLCTRTRGMWHGSRHTYGPVVTPRCGVRNDLGLDVLLSL